MAILPPRCSGGTRSTCIVSARGSKGHRASVTSCTPSGHALPASSFMSMLRTYKAQFWINTCLGPHIHSTVLNQHLPQCVASVCRQDQQRRHGDGYGCFAAASEKAAPALMSGADVCPDDIAQWQAYEARYFLKRRHACSDVYKQLLLA